MKYITFVARHHDRFALWDSKATNNMGYRINSKVAVNHNEENRIAR